MRPGKPFWLWFTAFFGNITAMFTVDQLGGDIAEAGFNLLGVVVISTFVSLAVYGKAKYDETNGG